MEDSGRLLLALATVEAGHWPWLARAAAGPCHYLDVLRMPPGASLLLQLARLSVLLLELPRLLWAVVLEQVTVTSL